MTQEIKDISHLSSYKVSELKVGVRYIVNKQLVQKHSGTTFSVLSEAGKFVGYYLFRKSDRDYLGHHQSLPNKQRWTQKHNSPIRLSFNKAPC